LCAICRYFAETGNADGSPMSAQCVPRLKIGYQRG